MFYLALIMIFKQVIQVIKNFALFVLLVLLGNLFQEGAIQALLGAKAFNRMQSKVDMAV